MADSIHKDPTKRHDFVLFFDVADGNPNGDPDAGNLPRVDPETMQGLVTDVCLKRKVRNYVDATCSGKEGMEIYVQNRGILANQQKRAYEETAGKGKKAEPSDSPNEKAKKWMCKNFYDVRMFGAVMTTGKTKESKKKWNCGQVRGPVQLTFSRSLDPVVPLDVSITRVALTNAGDTNIGKEDDEKAASGQMGRKSLVPYGLYKCHGFFISSFAEETGTTDKDLDLFWAALQNMWDLDRSSSRGMMACRGLHVFTHDSPLGNAPAHVLFDRVAAKMKDEVDAARSFGDYEVTVDSDGLPEGVTLSTLL